jgi:hypothetical protein
MRPQSVLRNYPNLDLLSEKKSRMLYTYELGAGTFPLQVTPFTVAEDVQIINFTVRFLLVPLNFILYFSYS